MKLENVGVGYEANFKPQSMDFSIGNPATIIRLLRDRLYSDKLRVCIQEYISNARDANREAGRPDHDITITVPTTTAPVFRVRDNGPGLSEERVRDVFTKFGSSTKMGTDQYTGGFGIGAKSGWAYTDSFMVKSYYGGKELHYLCHLGDSPTGTMSLVYEGVCKDPTGVEIEVQIKTEDVVKAFEHIIYTTQLWERRPQLINLKEALYGKNLGAVFLPSLSGGTDFYGTKRDDLEQARLHPVLGVPDVYESNIGLRNTLTLCVDGIQYGVQDAWLENQKQCPAFVLFARTGEVDVSASRESLELNQKLKDFLQTKRMQLSAAAWGVVEKLRDEQDITTPFPSYLKRPPTVNGPEEQAWRDRCEAYRKESQKILFEEFGVKNWYELAIRKEWTTPISTEGTSQLVDLDPQSYKSLNAFWYAVKGKSSRYGDKTLDAMDVPWFFVKDEKILRVQDSLAPVYWGPQFTKHDQANETMRPGRRRRRFGQHRSFRSGFIVDHNTNFPLLPSKPSSGYRTLNFLAENDQALSHAKIRRSARRILPDVSSIIYIHPMTDRLRAVIPKLSESIRPVERSYSVRAAPRTPTTGTYREIRLPGLRYSSNSVSFLENREADEWESQRKVIYRLPVEDRMDWEKKMIELGFRVRQNDFVFLHIPERTLPLLKKKNPKSTFIPVMEWLETWSKKPLTKVEKEALVARWVDTSMWGNLLPIRDIVSKMEGVPEKYREFIEYAHTNSTALYDYDSWLKMKAYEPIFADFKLADTRMYRQRMALLKKYPGIAIGEKLLDTEGGMRARRSRVAEPAAGSMESLFLSFFKGPVAQQKAYLAYLETISLRG